MGPTRGEAEVGAVQLVSAVHRCPLLSSGCGPGEVSPARLRPWSARADGGPPLCLDAPEPPLRPSQRPQRRSNRPLALSALSATQPLPVHLTTSQCALLSQSGVAGVVTLCPCGLSRSPAHSAELTPDSSPSVTRLSVQCHTATSLIFMPHCVVLLVLRPPLEPFPRSELLSPPCYCIAIRLHRYTHHHVLRSPPCPWRAHRRLRNLLTLVSMV